MQKKKYSKEIVLINNEDLKEIEQKIQKLAQVVKTTHYLISTDYKLENKTLTVTTDFISSCGDLKLPISPEQIKSVIEDVIKGLKVLEKHSYYHGSIKPSNILCEKKMFKLCHYYQKGITDSYIPNIETIKYESPEALKSGELSIESDLWSVGCVIYYLYCGKCPFEYAGSLVELFKRITYRKINEQPPSEKKDDIINGLIDNLIVVDTNERYDLNMLSKKLERPNNAKIYEKKDIVYLKCSKYVTDYKFKQNGVFYHGRDIRFINDEIERSIKLKLSYNFGDSHILQSQIIERGLYKENPQQMLTIQRLFLPMTLEERKELELESIFKDYIITSILKAIKALHSQNIIHGNINPSNILLDEKGEVFLTDYFMSSLYRNHVSPMDSVYYQSPNRLLDKDLNKDDDFWSYAMILLYLTDSLPSDSKSITNIYKFIKKLPKERIDNTSDAFIKNTAHDIVLELYNKNKKQSDENDKEKSIYTDDYLISKFSNSNINSNIDYMLDKNINVYSILDCFGLDYLLVPQSALDDKILDCIITIFNSTMSNSIFRFLVKEFPKTHLINMIERMDKIFQEKKKNLTLSPPKYTYVFYSPNYRIVNPSSSYDKCYSIFRYIIDVVQNGVLNINSSLVVEYYFYEPYLQFVKLKSLSLKNVNNRKIMNSLLRNIREQQQLQSLYIQGIKDNHFNCCLIASLKFLTNLESLSLIDMKLDCDFIENITELNKLRILNLDNSIKYTKDRYKRFYSTLSVCLSHINDLEELNLSKDCYGGSDIKEYYHSLTKFKNLKSIKLASCFIQYKNSFDYLSSTFPFYNLEILDLRDNLLGDNGIISIANHTNDLLSLKTLLLDGNKISNEGMKKWKDHLNQLQYLEVLSLSHNNITTKGLKIIENDLKSLDRLIDLDFSYNDLSDDEAFYVLDGIFKSLPYLHRVNINHIFPNKNNSNLLNDDENNVIGLNTVEISQSFYNSLLKVDCFNLSGNQLKSSLIFVIFYNNRQLINNIRELDLSNNFIGDNPSEFADLLEKLANLSSLNLSNNGITEEGIRELSDCFPPLVYLDLSKNAIKDTGLMILCKNTDLFSSLLHLDLSNNNLTDRSMSYLFNSALFLTSLNLNFNSILLYYEEVADQLSNLSNLKELSIGCNPISNDRILKSLTNLQELNIRGTNINNSDNTGFLYNQNTELIHLNEYISNQGRKLDMEKKGIDYNRSIIISNNLVGHSFIREMILGMNDINDDSLIILSEAIQFLSYLEVIDLSYNCISEYGFVYFASKIKYLMHLKKMDLRFNNVKNQDYVEYIKKATMNLTSLKIETNEKKFLRDSIDNKESKKKRNEKR